MNHELRTRVQGRLAGKVAVVTGGGASSEVEDEESIGSAIVAVFAAAGASVVVFNRSSDSTRRSVDRVAGWGVAEPFIGDVRSTRDCDAAAHFAREHFGRVDLLVNNAGVAGVKGVAGAIPDGDEEFAQTLDINLMGTIRMSRACTRHIGPGGAIVNMSSIGALRDCNMVDYAASKGALISLTRTMAVQLGPCGVRVNVICPGIIWGPMTRRNLGLAPDDGAGIAAARKANSMISALQQEGTAWDVALAALFLCSDEARWITGQTFVVDGGQTCLSPGTRMPA
jgi:NAD(P)-dependent dehydrogenase (short-subunit alcohol dehydrogenase family)